MSYSALHREYAIKQIEQLIEALKENKDVSVTDFTNKRIGEDTLFLSINRSLEKREIVISYEVFIETI